MGRRVSTAIYAPCRPIASTGAVLALALAAAPCALGAQGYVAEVVSAAPPEAVPAAVRALLGEGAIRISGPEGTFAELWLRRMIPAKAQPAPSLGVAYPRLIPGALVGVIRFAAEGLDYRGQRVQPGLYTLRYLLHPVDGNHTGVAPQRDFLLLAPSAQDQEPAALSFDALTALSGEAFGTGHPSVWSLPAPDDGPGSFPALVHREDEGLWILYTRVTLEPEGGEPEEVPLALVVAGQAPEA